MSQTAQFSATGDPLNDVRAYQGVRTRRIFAFLVDYAIVLALAVPAAILVAILGVLTLGLGWALYAVLLPLIAIFYVGFTMGGSAQATPGMRLFDIKVARLDGQPVDPILAVLHAVLFWASVSFLTPFVLLFSLFTRHKELLHDYLLGTVVARRG